MSRRAGARATTVWIRQQVEHGPVRNQNGKTSAENLRLVR
jgi:hypothetical protein